TFHHGAMTENQVATLAARLGDDGRESLADVLFGVLHAVERNLPHRHEAAEAGHLALESTLVGPGDIDLDDLPFFDIVPVANVDRGVGEREIVETIVGEELNDIDVDVTADFWERLFKVLGADDSLLVDPKIDKDIVLVDL